jgi:predicted Zn-dependent protease
MKSSSLSIFIFIFTLLLTSGTNIFGQDLTGGVGQFLTERPKNPPVNRKVHTARTESKEPKPAPTMSKGAVTGGAGVGASRVGGSTQSDAGMKDETEDALFLGNAARDATPPRYDEAERAYKLAIKLSPKDPRPYIGLGNIYYDQKMYEKASTAYKQALSLGHLSTAKVGASSGVGAIIGAIIGGGKGAAIGATIGAGEPRILLQRETRGEIHQYVGNSFLQQEKWADAEYEFHETVLLNPTNALAYASLGYVQLKQKKYTRASSSFKRAVQLDEDNETYKSFLKQALRHRRKRRK